MDQNDKPTAYNTKPFLRWTGSKNWFAKEHLYKFLPNKFENYHEPFLGGGAIFFSLDSPTKAFLSDTNAELVNTYKQVKNCVDDVIEVLRTFRNSEQFYYKIRKTIFSCPIHKAARLIYLNRTSFNGIYRVNDKGEYNVPYGKREKVDILAVQKLYAANKALQVAKISASTFEKTIKNIAENDLVFLDPPYTIAHENNGFIEYNKKLFSWQDQEKLADFVADINSRKAYFILCNAEHVSIRTLYKNMGDIYSVSRYSKVGGRVKTRGMFNEIVITNTI